MHPSIHPSIHAHKAGLDWTAYLFSLILTNSHLFCLLLPVWLTIYVCIHTAMHPPSTSNDWLSVYVSEYRLFTSLLPPLLPEKCSEMYSRHWPGRTAAHH